MILSPRNQLIGCLLLAGIGLGLFFSGEYRDLGLPLGWIGSVLFVAATWFCVDAVHRIPRSEDEAMVAPGEWQAWIGVAFIGAVIAGCLLNADAFKPELPIGRNPEAGAAAYVAVETVEGMLDGRAGGFAFVQLGTMDGGASEQTYVVAPGSGHGELAGISGVLALDVVEGEHRYTISYRLPG